MTRYAPAEAAPARSGAVRAGAAGPRPVRPAGSPPVVRPDRAVRVIAAFAADVIAVIVAAVSAGLTALPAVSYFAVALIALATAGRPNGRIGARVSDDAGRIVLAAAVPAAVVLAWVSPATAGLALTAAAAAVLLRGAVSWALRVAARRGVLAGRALVIGAGPEGAEIARLLRAHPEYGLVPCGVVDGTATAPITRSHRELPVLGPAAAAGALVSALRISQVLVCLLAVSDAAATAAIRDCRAAGARVSVLPALPALGLAVPRRCLDDIWGTALVPVRPADSGTARRAIKRATDVIAGSLLAVLTAPLVAVLAAAVRLDLGPGPFFRQQRVVGRGRRATITKLRTLRPGGNPDTTWVIPDGQVSGLGRVLRGSHADELTQLGSVLRGEMSLVGPRPERPYFAARLSRDVPGYADRERVPGGLTGWAQVHGLTGDSSIADRVRFDNYYIEYGSVWLDLLILAKTLPSAVSGVLTLVRGGSS